MNKSTFILLLFAGVFTGLLILLLVPSKLVGIVVLAALFVIMFASVFGN